jgi:peptidoglycan/LPS O-acetylase OafA/YrhL
MKNHIRALDGLRGIAITLVLVAHFVPYRHTSTILGRLVNGVAGIGWAGVSLFFVLSGFLITGILCDSKNGKHYLLNFFARRILRVFPLYYLMVFLCILVLPHFHATATARPTQDTWMYWIYLSNYHESFHPGSTDGWLGPLWSLCVEEHFYLLWPFIILLCRQAKAIQLSIACVFLSAIARALFIIHHNSHAPYLLTPCRIDDLALGSLVALLRRTSYYTTYILPLFRPLLMISGCLATGVTIWRHAIIWDPIMQLAGLPLFGIFFSSLLVFTVEPGMAHKWKFFLEIKPLQIFGKYSYGIYVLHPAVSALMFRFSVFPPFFARANDLVNALLLVSLSLGAAYLSWNIYESKFLSLKRFFEYSPQT